MFDFFQIISAKIAAFVTVVIVTVTSILPGAGSDTNKPADTSTATPSAIISESPSPSASHVIVEKQIPKKIPSSSTTPSTSPQKTNSDIQENRTNELRTELQKINQLKQQPTTETKNPVSTPTPIPTTTVLNIPLTNNSAPTNETIYSDYNFGYTYAGEVSPSSKMKILQFSPTSRDLRLARAIFRISNEDAEKYDSMDSSKYSHTTVMWFCKNSCQNYTLERTDKNTFLYVGSRTNGLQIAQGHIYVEIQIPTFAEGFITNISLPMSEWEIWDNSTGKLVKTQ